MQTAQIPQQIPENPSKLACLLKVSIINFPIAHRASLCHNMTGNDKVTCTLSDTEMEGRHVVHRLEHLSCAHYSNFPVPVRVADHRGHCQNAQLRVHRLGTKGMRRRIQHQEELV
jgi:hypothetical protein